MKYDITGRPAPCFDHALHLGIYVTIGVYNSLFEENYQTELRIKDKVPIPK